MKGQGRRVKPVGGALTRDRRSAVRASLPAAVNPVRATAGPGREAVAKALAACGRRGQSNGDRVAAPSLSKSTVPRKAGARVSKGACATLVGRLEGNIEGRADSVCACGDYAIRYLAVLSAGRSLSDVQLRSRHDFRQRAPQVHTADQSVACAATRAQARPKSSRRRVSFSALKAH
jgi:hypothetical protein